CFLQTHRTLLTGQLHELVDDTVHIESPLVTAMIEIEAKDKLRYLAEVLHAARPVPARPLGTAG
ncbi:hypothetical protein, partial [Nonomuraea sp. 10N515B]|uniref:hypothetical protein n=1 Tax=Nonomuraea sp. 10N515B TaxID=3457422 RepID=UPI003FCD8C4B